MTGSAARFLWWQFEQPARLWVLLVIPVLVIVYILILRLSKHRGIRYTNTGLVGAVTPRLRQWRRHVAVALALCSLAVITAAWAVPVGDAKVPRERATIVLVLDVSQSMMANDVQPSRLEAEKESAINFLTTLPTQFNVSLVTLSGQPNVLVPPTTDRAMLNQAIKTLELADGTALAAAIEVGLDAVKLAPPGDDNKPAPGLMVLLSDGAETSGGDPQAAATKAKEQQVPIFTIGVGTQNGYVDLDGRRLNAAPDTQTLKNIADVSGGQALSAKNVEALNSVYRTLGSDVGYETVHAPVTAQWTLYGLAIGMLSALGAVSLATRWP